MPRKIICLVACFSLFFAVSAFAQRPDSVIIPGDLRIMGPGNGLVFSDGSIQYQAAEQVFNSLINMVDEAVGVNCAKGGIMFQVGLDQNRSNLLESNEVAQTKYLCNASSVSPPPPLNALIGTWFHRATASSSNQTLTITDTTWQNNDTGNDGCIESGFYTYSNPSVTFKYGLNGGCHGEAANSTAVMNYTVSATTLKLYDPASGDLIVDYNK